MRPYQEQYIRNCQTIRELTGSHFTGLEDLEQRFDRAMDDRRRARELARADTELIHAELLPLLDDLLSQDAGVLAELEEFADELMKGPKALDVALACQIHEALLTCARHRRERTTVIRELYKLGMARYGFWNVLTGLSIPEAATWTSRMRYCFVEASSYLKYFDEFEDEETKGYIIRSLANTYMGNYDDWRDKHRCVRNTMRVVTDPHYRESAPGLPWDTYFATVHRQMSGVLPFSVPEGSLSPDAVADVMESAHLVYEKRFEDVRHEGQSVDAHNLLPYYATEFNCGLLTKEQLLNALEDLMDQVDPTRYDVSTTYQMVSLPAYYMQYLKDMPEMVEPRRRYVTQLCDRMLRYLRAMPTEVINDSIKLYVRQVMATFLELEGGVTYRELLLTLMARFAPELYSHGAAVSRLVREICAAILAGDPAFFDDIPEVAAASPGEERSVLLELAENASLLHDVGKVNFTGLYGYQGRQMLASEEEIMECHTMAGWIYLSARPSTRCCADVALGHHRWYDGSDGYPDNYQRLDSPYRALVDVLCAADFLERDAAIDLSVSGPALSFDEKLEQIFQSEGRQFSPMVASWLRDAELQAKLREICADCRREGYYQCFRFAAGETSK